MKLALGLAALVPPALADLPDGFVEQCCVLNGGGSRNLISDKALANLGGFTPGPPGDRLNGVVDPVCTANPPTEYTCFSFEQVCAGAGPFPGGNLNGGQGGAVCNNNANCYNPAESDATCTTITNPGPGGYGFPDIYWTCAAVGDFFCGFQCKFTDCSGDPHFETWGGKWYDYHGECDLVLMTNKDFGMGLGLDAHVRTTGRSGYSYIESAAVKIGDDVLEVSSFGEHAFNGVENADMEGAKFADQFPIEYIQKDKKTTEFKIFTGANEHIYLKAYKDWVSIKTNNATMYNFGSSEGMMGDFFEGKLLARDGTTIITDPDLMGEEWQVRADEPQLFQTQRTPQYPQKCILPKERLHSASATHRRLGDTIAKGAAEVACAGVEETKFNNCVIDVMAFGHLDIVENYN